MTDLTPSTAVITLEQQGKQRVSLIAGLASAAPKVKVKKLIKAMTHGLSVARVDDGFTFKGRVRLRFADLMLSKNGNATADYHSAKLPLADYMPADELAAFEAFLAEKGWKHKGYVSMSMTPTIPLLTKED